MEGTLHSENGAVVCERCTLARNPITRMRGLLGRRGLAQGEGLLLQPAGSIHTFFMRFPIDAVFLDRSGSVVDVVRRLKPWRAATRLRARAVLELAAGEAERLTLRVGERLEPVKAGK
jgi:uncharacterized membrane protein (UPF0127 family)